MLPALLVLFACGGDTPAPAPAPAPVQPEAIEVRATSFPAWWLAEQLAGDVATVENVHPHGEDPPSWQPAASIVAGLADVDLVVANGAGFEAWMTTAALPPDKVVYSARKLDLIELEEVTHSHGVDGEHSHGAIDPHTWSDPTGFFVQARAVHGALVKADPAHRAEFDKALAALERDLKNLGGRLRGATAHLQGKPLAASHPAFNYLARRYQLDVRSFDFDPSEPPSAESLAAFSAWADGKKPPVLLWEAPPTDAVRAAFPEGVLHQYLDPLENPGADGQYDYLAQADANADRLAALLQPSE